MILKLWIGEADPEVAKISGGKYYNVKLTISFAEEDKEAKEEEKEESEKVLPLLFLD